MAEYYAKNRVYLPVVAGTAKTYTFSDLVDGTAGNDLGGSPSYYQLNANLINSPECGSSASPVTVEPSADNGNNSYATSGGGYVTFDGPRSFTVYPVTYDCKAELMNNKLTSN